MLYYTIRCGYYTILRSKFNLLYYTPLPIQNNTYKTINSRIRPSSPASQAKYAFELDLHAARELFGIDFVIFRPHNATCRGLWVSVYGSLTQPIGKHPRVRESAVGVSKN